MNGKDKLNEFISSERNRFDNKHNNMFSFAFSQVSRYYGFLLVIQKRHKLASDQFISNFRQFQATMKGAKGSHPMTTEQMHIQAEGAKITTELHLEIESFYLFAKILLDKLTRAVEFYFGSARGLSLDSQDKFCKNIQAYAKGKGLEINAELVQRAEEMKKEISDFRDQQIAHHKSPRTVRGTMFGPDKETRMMLSNIYPKPEEKQVESKNIAELLKSTDNYIDEVLKFITANKDKTDLDLKSTSTA